MYIQINLENNLQDDDILQYNYELYQLIDKDDDILQYNYELYQLIDKRFPYLNFYFQKKGNHFCHRKALLTNQF